MIGSDSTASKTAFNQERSDVHKVNDPPLLLRVMFRPLPLPPCPFRCRLPLLFRPSSPQANSSFDKNCGPPQVPPEPRRNYDHLSYQQLQEFCMRRG